MFKKYFSRISNKSMRIRKDVVVYSGLYKILESKKHEILAYHGVAPKIKQIINHRHLDVDVFEKHLVFIKKNFHVISVEDFFNKKFTNGKKNVAITFDDGYKNNFKYAFPLLEKYNLPASIYVTGINKTNECILWPDLHDLVAFTCREYFDYDGIRFFKKGNFYKPLVSDFGINLAEYLKNKTFEEKMVLLRNSPRVQTIINNKEFSDLWETMTDEEIMLIDKSNIITIGSHGFFHNNLSNVSLKDASAELDLSKKYLEDILNRDVTSIAYPDGSYNRDVINISSEIGFKEQLAVVYRNQEDFNDDRIIDRKDFYDFETLSMQKLKMIK